LARRCFRHLASLRRSEDEPSKRLAPDRVTSLKRGHSSREGEGEAVFLGWDRVPGVDGVARDYYIRQLRDWKYSATVEQMLPTGMGAYARLCGWTLARAHARSGDRLAIAAYLGNSDKFDNAIADFAEPTPTRTSATTPRSLRLRRTAGWRPAARSRPRAHILP
jgi:hypothetical protein